MTEAPADIADLIQRGCEEARALEDAGCSPLSTPTTLRDLADALERQASELEAVRGERDGARLHAAAVRVREKEAEDARVSAVDRLRAAEAALAEAREALKPLIEAANAFVVATNLPPISSDDNPLASPALRESREALATAIIRALPYARARQASEPT